MYGRSSNLIGLDLTDEGIITGHRQDAASNAAPVVKKRGDGIFVAPGAGISVAAGFEISDANGDNTITQFKVTDGSNGASTGYLFYNNAPTSQVVVYSWEEFRKIRFYGGSSVSTDQITVQVSDGQASTSLTLPFTTRSINQNPAPKITVLSEPTLTAKTTVNLSSYVTVSDPSGDNFLVGIWVKDNNSDPTSGYIYYNNTPYQQGGEIFVDSLTKFKNIQFVSGSVSGTDKLSFNASDGYTFGGIVDVNFKTKENATPVINVLVNETKLTPGQSVALSSLIKITDADGNSTITDIGIRDINTASNSGYLKYKGDRITDGTNLKLSSVNDLSQVQFIAGTSNVSDVIRITAKDNTGATSNVANTTITTQPPNTAPVVRINGNGASTNAGETVAISSVFSVSDADGIGTITRITITDSTAGSGFLRYNGKDYTTNEPVILATASDLSKVLYVGGTTAGSDTITVVARDNAGAESGAIRATFTTTAVTPTNNTPVALFREKLMTVNQGEALALAGKINVSDKDGNDTITSIIVEDVTPDADSGQLFYDGTPIDQGGKATLNSISDLQKLSYKAGKGTGNNLLSITASDGQATSVADSATITTVAVNQAPSVTVPTQSTNVMVEGAIKLTDLVSVYDPEGADTVSYIWIEDLNTREGSGLLRYKGKDQNQGVRLELTSVADLAQVEFVGGKNAVLDSLKITAQDKSSASNNAAMDIVTLAPLGLESVAAPGGGRQSYIVFTDTDGTQRVLGAEAAASSDGTLRTFDSALADSHLARGANDLAARKPMTLGTLGLEWASVVDIMQQVQQQLNKANVPFDAATVNGNAMTATLLAVTGFTSYVQNYQYAAADPLAGITKPISIALTIQGSDLHDQMFGLSLADRLIGSGGEDYLNGGGGNDTLLGGAGNDRVLGLDGNDKLSGGAGDDTMVGGAGVDIAYFDGAASDYKLTYKGNTLTAVSATEADMVVDAEILVFNGKAMMMAGTTRDFFNESQYLALNPDVAAAVAKGGFANGYDHWASYGRAEQRASSLLFDSAYYLQQNPDIAAAVKAGATTAWAHFQNFGQYEGRDASPYFSRQGYLSANADIRAAGIDPLAHYLAYGQYEGRLYDVSWDVI